MGRKPSVNLQLPTMMRARRRGNRTYYYYDTGAKPRIEIPLGSDYTLAVQEWAKLQQAKPTEALTVAWAIGKYTASDDFTRNSTGTQADYRYALDKITEYFGDAPLDQVKPSHVQLYIDKRTEKSKHRAQRERSVFSMLFAWCIAREFCTFNPAAAIKGKKLPGRKHIDISDEMLAAVYTAGTDALRDAIDLAYFIGQRPADVLKVSETDIRDGMLHVRQNKTGTAIRYPVADGLSELVERIRARKRESNVHCLALLVDEKGKQMTKAKLRKRFEDAREKSGISGEKFQFRDLRRRAGADMRDIAGLDAAQALLGHKTQSMTEHYTAGRGRKISAILSKPAPLRGAK